MTITELTCYALDNDPSSDAIFTFTLSRRDLASGTVLPLATATIDSLGYRSTPRSSSTTTISSATVDNVGFSYYLRYDFIRDVGPVNSLGLINHGCRIAYEMTTLALP